MFEERGRFAEADARPLRPADSANGVDHRGDAPETERRRGPVRLGLLDRLLRNFPWHDRFKDRGTSQRVKPARERILCWVPGDGYPERVTQRGKRKWFERVMVGFGMILAALCFVIADGDKLLIVMGVLVSLSALSGLLRLVSSRERS